MATSHLQAADVFGLVSPKGPMKLFRFVCEVVLAGVMPVEVINQFICLKPAIRCIRQVEQSRSGFEWASVYDLAKRYMCWVSDQGLLLAYRTVKGGEVPLVLQVMVGHEAPLNVVVANVPAPISILGNRQFPRRIWSVVSARRRCEQPLDLIAHCCVRHTVGDLAQGDHAVRASPKLLQVRVRW